MKTKTIKDTLSDQEVTRFVSKIGDVFMGCKIYKEYKYQPCNENTTSSWIKSNLLSNR